MNAQIQMFQIQHYARRYGWQTLELRAAETAAKARRDHKDLYRNHAFLVLRALPLGEDEAQTKKRHESSRH